MKAMDPYVFEYFVGAIFEQRGYKATITTASGDEGVDVLLRKGLTKSVVQCKRYGDSVGQPVIRDLYGTMMHNKANEAYLVTTASITNQAKSWVRGKPIYLIDGFKLVEWVVESKTITRNRRLLWFFVALALMIGIINAYLYLPFTAVETFLTNLFPASPTQPADNVTSGANNQPITPPPPTLSAQPVMPPSDADNQQSVYLPFVISGSTD